MTPTGTTFRSSRFTTSHHGTEMTRPITVKTLWSRIASQQGETFTQIRGGEFTYSLTDTALVPDRTDWAIPRNHFEQALDLVPLANTVPVQHLYGPSYIYAVLMDERISQGDW